MLVHIVADDRNKISELRALFGSQHRVTSALLNEENRGPNECDALITAVDLRNADNIAALKQVSAAFNSTARKIFVIDRKVRLLAAQAYALGATHVLFRPVYQPSLLAALNGSGKPTTASEDDHQGGARKAASEGAASLASMFSAVSSGQLVDAAEAKHAAGGISDTIAEDGFSHWLETVRRHHEGTYSLPAGDRDGRRVRIEFGVGQSRHGTAVFGGNVSRRRKSENSARYSRQAWAPG
jgi:hypothetical protein